MRSRDGYRPRGDVSPRGDVDDGVLRRVEDRLPPGVRALRWRVSGRAAAAVAVLAVVLVVVAALVLRGTWPAGGGAAADAAGTVVPERSPAEERVPADGVPTSPSPVAATPAAVVPPVVVPPVVVPPVVVHVVGRVVSPGVVTLAGGSRVADALAAAGGTTPDAAPDRLNLARTLADGEQVVVPDGDDPLPAPAAPAAGAGTAGAGTAGGGAAGQPLDLNTATEADLDELPRVGEVLAGRIVAWRTEHGRFASVEELGEVPGIGPAVLDGLRDLVRV